MVYALFMSAACYCLVQGNIRMCYKSLWQFCYCTWSPLVPKETAMAVIKRRRMEGYVCKLLLSLNRGPRSHGLENHCLPLKKIKPSLETKAITIRTTTKQNLIWRTYLKTFLSLKELVINKWMCLFIHFFIFRMI